LTYLVYVGFSYAIPPLVRLSFLKCFYEASQWYGIGTPKATPAKIVEKLNKEINASLADPKLQARLADLGGTVMMGSPADFGKHIADETEKWGNVIRALNIKAE
jgi:tripartite-type tricarboxylate transporter receptor subunit TctC